MGKKLCITLDLEPDYAGLISESYEACDSSNLDPLIEIIKKYDIKLTVFVVGKMLEKQLPALHKLSEAGAEFELHSYSHSLNKTDTPNEIRKGKIAFKKYFGRNPLGYRTPQGRIQNKDFILLQQEGFKYDSSIFPAFWPGFKYITYPRNPYRVFGTNIVELPCATLPIRINISLSWLKLLGWPFYYLALNLFALPHIFIFNFHLHDLNVPFHSYKKLFPFWKFVYKRNKNNGLIVFEKFIRLMINKGYTFFYMSETYKNFVELEEAN